MQLIRKVPKKILIDFSEATVRNDLFAFSLLKCIFCSYKEKGKIMQILMKIREIKMLKKIDTTP